MKTDPTMIIGARAIGAALGLTQRQVYHLIERGALPTTKIGSRPASTLSLLREWIVSQENAARAACPIPAAKA